MDDYEAILNFLNKWRFAGWGERLSLLFTQHNEHRLLHSRIVFALYYSIFGDINFHDLLVIGDLQLIVIALTGVYFIRLSAGRNWKICSFIWVMLVFDLNSYEAGSIAMYALQNYGVIALFLSSLYCYSRGGKWRGGGFLFQVLCVFSSGGGMIGAFFILLYCLRGTDKVSKYFGILGMCTAGLYFIDYAFVSQPDKLPFDIRTVVVYFVRMSGAHFSFDYSLFWGLGVLILLVIFFPYNRVKKDLSWWPLICTLGFLLASMAAAALFRACLKGAQFQTSRYLIYPQLVIGIIVLFVASRFEGDKKRFPILIGMLLLFTRVYSGNFEFGKAGFKRTTARAELRRYWCPDQKLAALIAKTACDNGIYCIDEER